MIKLLQIGINRSGIVDMFGGKKIVDGDVDAFSVAEFFLSKKELTPKKLQKLVYYAYAWFIALYSDDVNHINVLFDEKPQAWVHGPVFNSLFQKYKEYQWHEIPKSNKKVKFENDDLENFLEAVWRKFGKYSADELEAMTHQEKPWVEARGLTPSALPSSTPLSSKTIYEFYSGL